METVRFDSTKEEKQKWLNHVVESDPWMARYVELPHIIKVGEKDDPVMVELAKEMLKKLEQED